MSTTFKLSEPLKTHDGDVTELKLKTPRAGLIVKHNDPFKVRRSPDGDGFEYEFDNKSMMAFATEMTGIDDLLLSDLLVTDFINLRQAIVNIILRVVPDRNPSSAVVA